MRRLTLLVAAALGVGAVAAAPVAVRAAQQRSVSMHQPAAVPGAPAAEPAPPMAVPFGVGERLEYDVKFGAIHVGSGSMETVGIERVRDRQAWHIVFRVKGGTFFYRVNDRYESWFDLETLSSLRYVQDIDEGRYERERRFEIFPERRVFSENDKPEQPTVEQPLDDGSFLYFIRTVPLEIGKTYTFDRYFRPDRNPVTIRVVRRERIEVPAGKFDAVVIQPVIKSKGIFSEGGHAEIWLADDSTHAMLQMKSKLSFGSLNLYLKSYRPAKTGLVSGGK